MKLEKKNPHPSAKSPDHCKRLPITADFITADELLRFHSKDDTPGGSNHGTRATKKKIVTGNLPHPPTRESEKE